MTRRRRIYALLLVLALTVTSFAGCGKGEKKKNTFSVRFELEGGDRVSGSLHQEVKKGEAAEEPKVEREGYFFSGWDTEFEDIQEDTVIKAVWKKAIHVTFDANGGEFSGGNTEVYLASGKKPTAPSVKREGYTFTGWEPEVSNVTEDTNFVAQWKRDVPTADEVYKTLSDSMVEIHTYDESGQGIALGSGFFIDTEGTVLTNFHVMEGAYSAEIVMYNEDTFEVNYIEGYDKDIDLCVIKTAASDTKPVTFFAGNVKTGETVYTIGSSVGLTGTFSNGIVSTASRQYDGVECIQITAPISHGNSGGPLVNEFGEVLGVNTFMMVDGQNLNFAVSIKELDNIDRSETITIEKFGQLTGESVKPNYTKVITGDEGEYVYEMTNDIELESNDMPYEANMLSDGYWKAAYLDDVDSIDFYYLTVPSSGDVLVYILAYWQDDDPYIHAYFRDVYTEEMPASVTGHDSYIGMNDYDDENNYKLATFHVPEAGSYYLDVHLPDDYPYDTGCYYLVGYEFVP